MLPKNKLLYESISGTSNLRRKDRPIPLDIQSNFSSNIDLMKNNQLIRHSMQEYPTRDQLFTGQPRTDSIQVGPADAYIPDSPINSQKRVKLGILKPVTSGSKPHLSLIRSKFRKQRDQMINKMFDEVEKVEKKRLPWKIENKLDVSFYANMS